MENGKFQKAAIALVLAIAVLFLLANYATAPEQSQVEFGEINYVYDGDTFEVKTETGELKTVRIIGADTPELQGPYRDKECYGPEASKFAQENFLGKKVYYLLRFEPYIFLQEYQIKYNLQFFL